MSGFGYNIDGMFLDNNGKLLLENVLKKDPPKTLVVLNEINYAIHLKKLFPNCEVIFRQFWGNEYDSIYNSTSVDDYLRIYNEAIKNNLVCYTNNEPKVTKELYDWEYELGIKILERKGKAVLVNYCVGAPNHTDNDFNMGRHLFNLIGNNRGKLYLGFHEYFFGHAFSEFFPEGNIQKFRDFKLKDNDKPWIMARHRWMLDWCNRNNIKKPSIIITEYGWDDVPAMHYLKDQMPSYQFPYRLPTVIEALKAYSSASGMSMVDYTCSMFYEAWRAYYGASSDVLGTCFFSFGGNGVWDKMSIHHFPDIVNNINNFKYENSYKQTTTIIKDYDKMINGNKLKKIKWVGGNVNFRPEPTTNNKPIFVINYGNEGYIVDNVSITANGYNFSMALMSDKNNNFYLGWFANNIPESKFIYI